MDGMMRLVSPCAAPPTELRRRVGAAAVEAAFPLFSAPSERLRERTERQRDDWTRALDERLEFRAAGDEP